jgi:hypothetical protein
MAMATALRGPGRGFGLAVRASGLRALPGGCTATRLRLPGFPAWPKSASVTLREQHGFDDEMRTAAAQRRVAPGR